MKSEELSNHVQPLLNYSLTILQQQSGSGGPSTFAKGFGGHVRALFIVQP